ncbi:hypothetical protein ACLKA6_007293 [Drosophila palustris]
MNADQKIDALIELVKKQQEQIKILADQIANQTVLIRQILTERSNSEELLNIFPLEKEEDMLRLEDENSNPDTASGDVEEELRLALMAQKKIFHKKNSLKRKTESQENAAN